VTRPFRVVFVCSDNSCRSQMAEGWLRHLAGAGVVARSGGADPRHVNPMATRAMQEGGVDIAGQRGKGLEAFSGERFDLAVTLCDGSRGACAEEVVAARVEHRHFEDPAWLEDPDEPDLEPYLELRDALRAYVEELLGSIEH
jgi:arsenate reductase